MTSTKINHSVIPKNGTELAIKLLIKTVVKPLVIAMEIPDLSFDSAGIVDNGFWHDMESNTRRLKLSFISTDSSEFQEFIEAIELPETNRKQSQLIQRWPQISTFLKALPVKCHNTAINLFSSSIIQLLRELIIIRQFSWHEDIMECMSFCLKSISVLSEKVGKATNWNSTVKKSVFIIEFFFNIIRREDVFLNEIFKQDTLNILEKGSHADPVIMMEKFAVIKSVLSSNNNEAKTTIFEHCTIHRNLNRLISFVRSTSTNQKGIAECLQVLHDLLSFSRKNELHFECDWIVVFRNLYSPIISIRKATTKLFLLEEQKETATEFTLLETAINAYRLQCDDSNITDIIDIFGEYEDFESCEKLFDILRIHSDSDERGMLTIVILIINAAADRLARCDTKCDQLIKLLKNVILHLKFVKPYPHLLYRLMNIVDFVRFKNVAELNEHFLSVEKLAEDAFYECDQYSAAVGYLEILLKIGLGTENTSKMFEKLIIQQMSVNNRQCCLRFLAADDTLNMFYRIHPDDKMVNYEWCNDIFQHSADPEIQALNLALNVNMLAAISSLSDIPNMPQDFLKEEADFFGKYLDSNVLKPSNSLFTKTILCTALCVLHSKFTLPIDRYVFSEMFCVLHKVSSAFRQTFNTDLREDDDKDLKLIRKFWSKLTELYEANNQIRILPYSLFEYYMYADNHLKQCVEDFLTTCLKYLIETYRYAFFSENVLHCVRNIEPVTNAVPCVKKLFFFIENSNYSDDINAIAFKTFMTVLKLLRQNDDRSETVHTILKFIYTSYLTPENCDLCLEAYLKHVKKTINPHDITPPTRSLPSSSTVTSKPSTPPTSPPTRSLPSSSTVTSKPSSSNITKSSASHRRSYSLAAVNQSLLR